jgi:hypothetical protein
MEAQCRREVGDLHRFLVAWMTGAVPRTAAVFARFEGVLADGFALIGPSGVITERVLIVELEAAHGTRRDQGLWARAFSSVAPPRVEQLRVGACEVLGVARHQGEIVDQGGGREQTVDHG